jgi:hypothetical protein
MVTKVTISFSINDKAITVEREIQQGEDMKSIIEQLLLEIESIGITDRATAGQMRALYGKAMDRGWSKEKVKELLNTRFGTSEEGKIVGVVGRAEFSQLIDEIGESGEITGKTTGAQMRIFWGKALDKGWTREKIKDFLEKKLGTNREEEIIGKVDKERFSQIIEELGKK